MSFRRVSALILGALLLLSTGSVRASEPALPRTVSPFFPALDELLEYYTNAFSHSQARAEGKIVPTAGVCQQYDDALNEIRDCEKSLNEYLNKQKKLLKNHDIKYVHVQKTRYAMEIPESACRHLDDDYELMNSRKGFKRSVAKSKRCTQSYFDGRGFSLLGITRANYVN